MKHESFDALRRVAARWLAVSMCVAITMPPAATAALLEPTDTNTAEIFTTTISGVGSCLRWTPKGVCLWLVCSRIECHVDETLRIAHYTPDVTISTFHDPATHPWKDYGRTLAQQTGSMSNWMLGQVAGGALGSVLGPDSAGTKTMGNRDTRNFMYRGADAIGNPVNFVQGILSGDFGISGTGPGSIPVPLPIELGRWFGDFPNQVAAQWSSIGASYSTDQTTSARQEIGKYTTALGLVSGVSGAAGQVVNLYNTAMNAYTTGGMLMNAGGVGTVASVGVGGSDLMCPPGIMPFGLAFQSDLDSFFWRGLVPLESIYPATWLPGMREVGQGLFQTWGNVWPRTGMIFQQHPVKGAAVLAQRVGDIISHPAQPHIYSMLQVDTNPKYHFFGFQGIKEHDESHTLWQRVFPNPQSQCTIFGSNDSFALMGFGDGQNMNNRGTVWNAWRKQDCCKKPSGGAVFFLGSVP